MASQVKRERIVEPGRLRAAGIIAVVIIHASAIAQGNLTAASPLYPAYYGLTRFVLFGVPLFIFVSGLVLGHRYGTGAFSVRAFYRRRFATVLFPYAFWTVIYHLYTTVAALRNGGLATAGGLQAALLSPGWWVGLTKAFLLGTAYYHLYFVVIIIQFYLLFPLLQGAARALSRRPVLAFGLAALVHLGYVVVAHQLRFAYNDRFFLTYFIFFAAGLLAGRDLTGFRRWALKNRRGLAGSFSATAGLYVGFTLFIRALATAAPRDWVISSGLAVYFSSLTWAVYSLSAAAYLFALAAARTAPASRSAIRASAQAASAILGAESFGIYLVHPLVLDGLERLFTHIGPASTSLRFAIEVAGALAISAITSRWLRRMPVGRLLLGR